MNDYPYIRSLTIRDGCAVVTDTDGNTRCLSPNDLRILINDLTEDVWIYQERCHEFQKDAEEWLYAYEQVSALLYN